MTTVFFALALAGVAGSIIAGCFAIFELLRRFLPARACFVVMVGVAYFALQLLILAAGKLAALHGSI